MLGRMYKRALIVHGKPSKDTYFNPEFASASNAIWIPWLQQQLLQRDIATQTPEMLRAYQPDYALWKETFEQFALTPDTLLVGHSCGGGFLVQWLSEHPDVKVGDVFLVAPAFGDSLTPDDRYDVELLGGFFDFTPDAKLTDRVRSLHLLYSDNDSSRVDATVELLKQTYPTMSQRLFPGYGHFSMTESGERKTTFPELIEMIDQARA